MVTETFREAVFDSETGDGTIILLTISHADLSPPIRLARNPVEIVSRGNTFLACGFEAEFPALDGTLAPRARLTVDNVDRRIVQGVRLLTFPVNVLLEIVSVKDIDTVEMSIEDLTLVNVSYDSFVVEGDLALENIFQEGLPKDSFDPARFPGGF